MNKCARKAIPKEIWNQPRLKEYSKGVCFGYVGASNRTKKTDKLVIKELKKHGLDDRQIAIWLTSTSGRHMMDEGTTKSIKNYAKHATKDLCKWGELFEK